MLACAWLQPDLGLPDICWLRACVVLVSDCACARRAADACPAWPKPGCPSFAVLISLACRRVCQAAAGNAHVQRVLAEAAAAAQGPSPGPTAGGAAAGAGAGAAAVEAGGIVPGPDPDPVPGQAAGAGAALGPGPDPDPTLLAAGAAQAAGEPAGGVPHQQDTMGPMQAASPTAPRVRLPAL